MTDKFSTDVVAKVKDNTIMEEACQPALLAALEKIKPEIRAHQSVLVEKFLKAHADDLAQYEFRCERYGDFLAVFAKRGEDGKKDWYGHTASNRLVAAINIGQTPQITLTDGHSVDLLGTANPRVEWRKDGCGYKAEIHAGHPSLPYSRSILTMPVKQENCSYGYGSSGRQLPAIDACARASKDDLVHFVNGAGTLHVPFGRGREVFDKVLAAIK